MTRKKVLKCVSFFLTGVCIASLFSNVLITFETMRTFFGVAHLFINLSEDTLLLVALVLSLTSVLGSFAGLITNRLANRIKEQKNSKNVLDTCWFQWIPQYCHAEVLKFIKRERDLGTPEKEIEKWVRGQCLELLWFGFKQKIQKTLRTLIR